MDPPAHAGGSAAEQAAEVRDVAEGVGPVQGRAGGDGVGELAGRPVDAAAQCPSASVEPQSSLAAKTAVGTTAARR